MWNETSHRGKRGSRRSRNCGGRLDDQVDDLVLSSTCLSYHNDCSKISIIPVSRGAKCTTVYRWIPGTRQHLLMLLGLFLAASRMLDMRASAFVVTPSCHTAASSTFDTTLAVSTSPSSSSRKKKHKRHPGNQERKRIQEQLLDDIDTFPDLPTHTTTISMFESDVVDSAPKTLVIPGRSDIMLPATEYEEATWIGDDFGIVDFVDSNDSNNGMVQMERDESDILEEREDRLYVDERGVKRKVESCILVGVEDISVKRQKQRKASVALRMMMTSEPNALGGRDGIIPITTDDVTYFSLEESMVEMRELLKTAGLEIVGEVTQRLQQINPKTYIGTGKVEEAKELMKKMDCSTIVFDAELSPGQQKALENAFNQKIIQNDFLVQGGEIKVIDRTALILDIFAQHAKTREGKLQVDLALHEYRKPRLTKMWTHLERQSGAGGVGLRGPGERQLEIDKRLVRDRIIALKKRIDEVQEQRSMHRRGRQRMGLPILALVGYTNSGKSTMLNYLTRSGVLAESMLFATLDPTTRKVKLPGLKTHPEVLLTDTVGFIQKLPTHLVAAFRATLEEVKQADVLVHVIDVSNPVWEKQETAVKTVLEELGVTDKPIVRVLNKLDLLPHEDADYVRYGAAMEDLTVAVSALHGAGMHDFVSVVEQAMSELLVPVEVIIPYSAGMELNSLHEQGNVETIDYRESGTYVRALVPAAIASRLEKYSITPSNKSQPQQKKKKLVDQDGIDWVSLGRGRHSGASEKQKPDEPQ